MSVNQLFGIKGPEKEKLNSPERIRRPLTDAAILSFSAMDGRERFKSFTATSNAPSQSDAFLAAL